jgi:methionyl-tRNA formyltransferase
MRTLNPDLLLVFGTGILREEIITAFRGRIINIHLGLSPYYRGSGTNFWPLVNGEPEYVGATIHSLDSGIDTGDIFLHVRPDIAPDDGPHDIGNKAIQAAADGLALVAERFVQGGLPSTPQSGKGRFYQRKDFSADAVRTLYERFEKGMVPEYLAHRAERDAHLSLVSLPL